MSSKKVIYVKHHNRSDAEKFEIGQFYNAYSIDFTRLYALYIADNYVGLVYDQQIAEVFHDCKLNRALYPDYKVVGEYLCPKA